MLASKRNLKMRNEKPQYQAIYYRSLLDKLQKSNMGTQTSSEIPANAIKFYSFAYHSLLGQVPVYSIADEGKYVMKIKSQLGKNNFPINAGQKIYYRDESSSKSLNTSRTSTSPKKRKNPNLKFEDIFLKIAERESDYLITFFRNSGPFCQTKNDQTEFSELSSSHLGQKSQNIQKNSSLSSHKPKVIQAPPISFCTIRPDSTDFSFFSSETEYWEFLNYDIESMQKKKNSLIPESIVREAMIACIEASKILKQFGIYQQFEKNKIQFSTEMFSKVYWLDISPDNSHRSYFRYCFQLENPRKNHAGKPEESYYAPQQLTMMRKNLFNDALELEKCVVYNLGMIFLSCCTGKNTKSLYLYNKLQINEKVKQQFLGQINAKKYSKQLVELIREMLMITPRKRPSYGDILAQLQSNDFRQK